MLDVSFVYDAALVGDRYQSILVGALVLACIKGTDYLEQVQAFDRADDGSYVYTTQVCGAALLITYINTFHGNMQQMLPCQDGTSRWVSSLVQCILTALFAMPEWQGADAPRPQ